MQGPAPSGSSLVSVSVIIPKNPADGVKVTVAGVVVEPVLLKVPLPAGAMDQVPVVVPPVTLAPDKVIGSGVED
jgi:hypothetical protein